MQGFGRSIHLTMIDRSGRGGALGVILAILLTLAIAAAIGLAIVLRSGGDADDWVVRQVTRITNAYLAPQISFVESEFEFPYTLHLRDVKLVAPTGENVIEAGQFVVTLAERPRWGAPIVIQEIAIHDASLRLLQDVERGGFKGLVPFVRTSSVRSPETVPEDVRLSRVLRIRHIALRNASIEYDDGSGSPPMKLDGIELAMNVAPQSTVDSAAPVMHNLDFSLDRSPIFSLDVLGAVSLDDFEAMVERLDLKMEVGEATYSALPPMIQGLMREYDARGSLRVLLNGAGGLREPAKINGAGTVTLDEFNVAAGGYRLPIDRATIELEVRDGTAQIAPARIDLLGGVVTLTAESAIATPGLPTKATWDVRELQLADLLRAQAPEGAEPKLAGLTSSEGEITLALNRLPESIEGTGSLNIMEARLISIPVMTRIAQMMDQFSSVFGGGGRRASVESAFKLTGEGLTFDLITFTNPISAASAHGDVSYDGRLDLTATAGPVQRIQGLFGRIGDVVGKVTGQLIRYRIRGTVAQPNISVHPLGLGS